MGCRLAPFLEPRAHDNCRCTSVFVDMQCALRLCDIFSPEKMMDVGINKLQLSEELNLLRKLLIHAAYLAGVAAWIHGWAMHLHQMFMKHRVSFYFHNE